MRDHLANARVCFIVCFLGEENYPKHVHGMLALVKHCYYIYLFNLFLKQINYFTPKRIDLVVMDIKVKINLIRFCLRICFIGVFNVLL